MHEERFSIYTQTVPIYIYENSVLKFNPFLQRMNLNEHRYSSDTDIMRGFLLTELNNPIEYALHLNFYAERGVKAIGNTA